MKNRNEYLYTHKGVKLKHTTEVFTTDREAEEYAKHKRSYTFQVYDVKNNWVGVAVPK